jgi:hypothetical protein
MSNEFLKIEFAHNRQNSSSNCNYHIGHNQSNEGEGMRLSHDVSLDEGEAMWLLLSSLIFYALSRFEENASGLKKSERWTME